MIKNWIASVFIKRVMLALASGAAAYYAAHGLPAVSHLSAWGLNMTLTIDPEKFADAASVGVMALSQGAHEWLAAKYPAVGQYL